MYLQTFIINITISILCSVHDSVAFSSQFIHTFRTNDRRIFTLLSASLQQHDQERQNNTIVDNRPHEQRRNNPRTARRLNHSFQHLWRHDSKDIRYHLNEGKMGYDGDNSSDTDNTFLTNTTEFLIQYGGYSSQEIKFASNEIFPPLLGLDIHRHLKVKMRFAKYTLGALNETSGQLTTRARNVIPWSYYGSRLETCIAPRHAFLAFLSQSSNRKENRIPVDFPHSENLISNPEKMRDFLINAGKSSKQYASMCNRWAGHGDRANVITSFHVEQFEQRFRRGLMAAARGMDFNKSPSTTGAESILASDEFYISSGSMIQLLIKHGANAQERDTRGVSLLHWSAGAGNLEAYKVLEKVVRPLGSEEEGDMNLSGHSVKAERDGALPIHWAVSGSNGKEFGTGGHFHIVQYILENAQRYGAKNMDDVINAKTKDGNSVLMWACWAAGSLDIVKLLLSFGASTDLRNRNGCSVAHWAASGGNLEICKYLHNVVGVEFVNVQNHAGNTPLSHAVAYKRVDVVRWLNNDLGAEKVEEVDTKALAESFVMWTDGTDHGRVEILDIFSSTRV